MLVDAETGSSFRVTRFIGRGGMGGLYRAEVEAGGAVVAEQEHGDALQNHEDALWDHEKAGQDHEDALRRHGGALQDHGDARRDQGEARGEDDEAPRVRAA